MTFRRIAAALLGIGAAGLAAGCSETQLVAHGVKEIVALSPEPEPAATTPSSGQYKVGKPYQIEGVWYYPKADPTYNVVGLASWYGADFHGKRTANGAIYDMNALTAAHKTLPMPSKVRVTNLDNGRSLVLEINDRGPFVNGRIIDLSRRSAQLLGFEQRGLAMVRVQAVSPENGLSVAERPVTPPEEQELAGAAPRTDVAVNPIDAPAEVVPAPPLATAAPELAPPAPAMFIQAGAFTQQDNAGRLAQDLSRFGVVRIVEVERDGRIFHRVRLGPIATVEQADALLQDVIRSGHAQAHLVIE
ncbi:MAG: septal ring lytic transglycosylase RlpA family protein [Alphaproteobacteria bacterium]|jgi:rare lipoprotein A|nr:septal ring lytic transglycosylase RlpA family protein [Alphaproteobacteria bacterium]MDP6515753.1 septal ring lytic transglycosylase RlpA family protein [Alphaproteobacteria bacterium]